jgi:hypothetical protein
VPADAARLRASAAASGLWRSFGVMFAGAIGASGASMGFQLAAPIFVRARETSEEETSEAPGPIAARPASA